MYVAVFMVPVTMNASSGGYQVICNKLISNVRSQNLDSFWSVTIVTFHLISVNVMYVGMFRDRYTCSTSMNASSGGYVVACSKPIISNVRLASHNGHGMLNLFIS